MDVLVARLWNKSNMLGELDSRSSSHAAKLIGQSGNKKYHDFLKEYASITGDPKTREYAGWAAENIGQSGVEQYVPQLISNADDSEFISSARKKIIEMSIVSGERYAAVSVAKKLMREGNYDVGIMDMAAERVWRGRAEVDKDTVKTLKLFVKMLGRSGNPRYRTVLEKISSGNSSEKMAKYAVKVLETLPNSKVDQFVPQNGW